MKRKPSLAFGVKTSIQILIAGVLATGTLLLLTHCGGSNSASTTPGTFTDVYATMNVQNCSQCHSPGGTSPDLSSQQTAYTSLTTLTSTGINSTGCTSIPLVAPTNPGRSFLEPMVDSNYDTTSFGGTACTPDNTHLQHFGTYTDAEKSSLTAWIQAGAANN